MRNLDEALRQSRNVSTGQLLFFGGLSLGLSLLLKAAVRRKNRIEFAGRTVLITGGSRGLGLALARELVKQGASVAILARDRAELERARQDLAPLGANVLPITCDVANQESMQAAVHQVISTFRRLDVLVNNAGVIQVGPLEHMSLADYEEAMAVHHWGPLYAMLAVVPHMRQQGGGRIINIASIGGEVAVPHLAPYTASKFALTGLSDAFRVELARENIQVTTVNPGLMRTGSHVNAYFKGDHRKEYAWFSILGANPLFSTSTGSAVRQILDACKYGQPSLVITPQARLLILANHLVPGLFSVGMRLFNRFLPAPVAGKGYEQKLGWDSTSSLSPSFLTTLSDRAVGANNEN